MKPRFQSPLSCLAGGPYIEGMKTLRTRHLSQEQVDRLIIIEANAMASGYKRVRRLAADALQWGDADAISELLDIIA